MRDNWSRLFGDTCNMCINMDGMASMIRSQVSDNPEFTEYTSPQVIHV
jgi:hypothetical protein